MRGPQMPKPDIHPLKTSSSRYSISPSALTAKKAPAMKAMRMANLIFLPLILIPPLPFDEPPGKRRKPPCPEYLFPVILVGGPFEPLRNRRVDMDGPGYLRNRRSGLHGQHISGKKLPGARPEYVRAEYPLLFAADELYHAGSLALYDRPVVVAELVAGDLHRGAELIYPPLPPPPPAGHIPG